MFLSRKIKGKTIGGAISLPHAGVISIPNPFLLPGSTTLTPIYFGNKKYELPDWLGNVRVVINDRKTPVNTGNVTVSYMPQVLSVSDYYSFGSEIFERTYSHNEYRFGFNGKEDLHEQRWYQDYGARFYHKALGRFVSADPLIVKERKYAWLTPYQFASNTPIQAKDIDGLEAYFVHGTWSDTSAWNNESVNMISNVTDNKTKILFSWSGHNVHQARYEAAMKLVNEIYKTQNPDEPLTLIGHSHGGNVAILAANILRDFGSQVDYLITINTPVREYQLKEGAVQKHINIYQEYDPVQFGGGNRINIPDAKEYKIDERTLDFMNSPLGLKLDYVSPLHNIFEGKRKYLSGEIGKAGREFKRTYNYGVPFDIFNIHNTHNTPELWHEWMNNVLNNTSDKSKQGGSGKEGNKSKGAQIHQDQGLSDGK